MANESQVQKDAPPMSVVVGIAGGSGSGKTTLVHRLAKALGPERVLQLQQDWYYHDLGHLTREDRESWNFDRPEAIDLNLLIQHLVMLRRGEVVTRPDYDFATHTRSALWKQAEPREVVLLEGTLVLADAPLRAQLDLGIFVAAPKETRLTRRLERDVTERGRSRRSCLEQHRRTVWPMHELHVEPSRRYAQLLVPGDPITSDSIEVATRRIEYLARGRRATASQEFARGP